MGLRRSNSRRGASKRLLVLVTLAVGTVFLGLLALAGGDARAGRDQAKAAGPLPPARSTTGRQPWLGAQPGGPGIPGTYQVGSAHFNFVERPASLPPRPLPTRVWYPATREEGRLVPDRAYAPYPLIVFSQGYDIRVSAYQRLLVSWASAGFVVAAPTYPHTAPSAGRELDESDILNHPADLRFVISAVLGEARRAGSALSGLVNPGRVGLAGHSDGGEVTLAVAANTCCRDPRVKAAAVLSGAELVSFGGKYFGGPPVPLLVVQGDQDQVNPPACSTQVYNSAPSPKYFLDLLGAGHEPPYAGPAGHRPQYRQVVTLVTTYFFDATLAGEPAALAKLRSAGDVAGVAELKAGGRAPIAPGYCPGAPPWPAGL